MRISPPAQTLLCLCGIVFISWALPGLKLKFSGQIYVAIFLVVVGVVVVVALRCGTLGANATAKPLRKHTKRVFQ